MKDGTVLLGAHDESAILPLAAIETVQVQGPILIKDYATEPATSDVTEGAIRYNGTDFQGFADVDDSDAPTWVSLTQGDSGTDSSGSASTLIDPQDSSNVVITVADGGAVTVTGDTTFTGLVFLPRQGDVPMFGE
jgi:hypothetical protein